MNTFGLRRDEDTEKLLCSVGSMYLCPLNMRYVVTIFSIGIEPDWSWRMFEIEIRFGY